MHEKRHDCAHFIDEKIKTHLLGIEENVALAHGSPKPRSRSKERNCLKVEEKIGKE